MHSVIMLNVIVLIVVKLNVIMLSVVVPFLDVKGFRYLLRANDKVFLSGGK
jgi:hypothetical protein